MDGVLIDTEKYLTPVLETGGRRSRAFADGRGFLISSAVFPVNTRPRGLQGHMVNSTITGPSGSGEKS